MAKRRRAIGLSFLLLKFALGMLLCMLLSCMVWFSALTRLQYDGAVYRASEPYLQVQELIERSPERFVAPGADFLAEYALFDGAGEIAATNASAARVERMKSVRKSGARSDEYTLYVYADGRAAAFYHPYLADFRDPALRAKLPNFERMWLLSLGGLLIAELFLCMLRLRRRLNAALAHFGALSAKIAAQELDFDLPRAGVREYDRALEAMGRMRDALRLSLSEQWAARSAREAEIAALAHDLKTPLTLIGGNAELLLEEETAAARRDMLETIARSCSRAQSYVANLLELGAGADEAFAELPLPELFEELRMIALPIAAARGCELRARCALSGSACAQRQQILRAAVNLIQNAAERAPAGSAIALSGDLLADGWQIVVRDAGSGFSEAALRHARERLWRDDAARAADGHNGLGLWIADRVARAHGGELILRNWAGGAEAALRFSLAPRGGDAK